jgi:hypothetical protein
VGLLVGDDLGYLIATGVNDAHDALFDGREHNICRENEPIPLPQYWSRRKWRAGVGDTRGRGVTPFSFGALREVGRIFGLRLFLSANGFLDESVNDLDGLRADFDGLSTDKVGLGQS